MTNINAYYSYCYEAIITHIIVVLHIMVMMHIDDYYDCSDANAYAYAGDYSYYCFH